MFGRKYFENFGVAVLVNVLLLALMVPFLVGALEHDEIELITTDRLDFEETAVGDEDRNTAVFRNTDSRLLTLEFYRRTNPYFNLVEKEIVLQPEADKEVYFNFKPVKVGQFRGEVAVRVKETGQVLEVGVEGIGVAAEGEAGEFQVIDQEVDFGGVELHDQISDRIVLQNNTAQAIAVAAELENSEHFKIVSELPVVVGPNQTDVLELAFAPQFIGKQNTILKLISGDNEETVVLRGRGLALSGRQSEDFVSHLEISFNDVSKMVVDNNEAVDISYRLNYPAHVTVTIQQNFNVIKTIKEYDDLEAANRLHTVEWDLAEMPAGRYRYVIDAYNESYGAAVAYGTINVTNGDAVADAADFARYQAVSLAVKDLSDNNGFKVQTVKPANVVLVLFSNGEIVEVVDRFYALAGQTYEISLAEIADLADGDYEYKFITSADDEKVVNVGSLKKTGDVIELKNGEIVEAETDLITDLSLSRLFLETEQNQTAAVSFGLAKAADVKINVVKDEIVVANLLNERLEAGQHNDVADWDAVDYVKEEMVAAGIYLVKVEAVEPANVQNTDTDSVALFVDDSPFISYQTAVKANDYVGSVEVDLAEAVDFSKNLTRAEVMAALTKWLNMDFAGYQPESDLALGFGDLKNNSWLLSPFKTFIKTGWITRAAEEGILLKEMIEGYPGEVLHPDRLVNQAEFYKLVVEGLANQRGGTTLQIDRNPREFCFDDVVITPDTQWYLPYAQFVCAELDGTGIINKYHVNQQFDAHAPVTFEQLIDVMKVVAERNW